MSQNLSSDEELLSSLHAPPHYHLSMDTLLVDETRVAIVVLIATAVAYVAWTRKWLFLRCCQETCKTGTKQLACVENGARKGQNAEKGGKTEKSATNPRQHKGRPATRQSEDDAHGKDMDVGNANASNTQLVKDKGKYHLTNRRVAERLLYEIAKASATNNVVTRQLCGSCVDLDNFDRTTELGKASIRLKPGNKSGCYGCGKHFRSFHPVYVFSCYNCGQRFQEMRHLSRSLAGCVSLVIGCRTKLGHQVTLKLLRAGSKVIGTTRRPKDAMRLFELYHDGPQLLERLIIYPHALDLDVSDLVTEISRLRSFIDTQTGVLDNLVICAAQTIRARDKDLNPSLVTNRYGDARFVNHDVTNSWQMTLHDLPQQEMEEVLRVNAVAPCLIVQTLSSLMQKSLYTPYIVNVHAREGLFQVRKSASHIHTNMAKAALAMLTKCLLRAGLKTHGGIPFSIHGCDPGWISVDEYYENDRPWIVPPLDEVDGAARILFPIFQRLDGCSKTRRHFYELSY